MRRTVIEKQTRKCWCYKTLAYKNIKIAKFTDDFRSVFRAQFRSLSWLFLITLPNLEHSVKTFTANFRTF